MLADGINRCANANRDFGTSLFFKGSARKNTPL
jgi:hypothetical protein